MGLIVPPAPQPGRLSLSHFILQRMVDDERNYRSKQSLGSYAEICGRVHAHIPPLPQAFTAP